MKAHISMWSESRGIHRIEVDALPTDTPGLVLAEIQRPEGLLELPDGREIKVQVPMYRLTHARSGFGFGHMSADACGLRTLAHELGAALDWTQDEHTVWREGRKDKLVRKYLDAANIEWVKVADAPGVEAASMTHLGGAA